jgi:hypothetical protein
VIEPRKLKNVGICSIATNDYISLWIDMVTSADKIMDPQFNIVFHVFTDQVEYCTIKAKKFTNIECRIHQISNLTWPAATMDRYKVFFEARETLIEEFLVHMDADMLMHKNFLIELTNFELKEDITCVAHPGFWRSPSTTRNVRFLFRDLKDFLLKIRFGGLGTWETRRISTAFVPRSARKNYVCGGVWMGERSAFIDLCQTLYTNVEKDYTSGIIAKWHDESHLNNWVSKHEFNLIPPSFCFSREFPHLSRVENIIEAVTKEKKYTDLKQGLKRERI